MGHLARMGDHRLPKQMLLGWLPQRRPSHGVKLHWLGRMRQDLKHFHINESDWYAVAQEKDQWSQLCVWHPLLYLNQCSWSYFVINVIDTSGDLP